MLRMTNHHINRSDSPCPSADKGRVYLFDAISGFSVASMVCFHLTYDLVFLWGYELPWFYGQYQDIWRNSISWTFLFLAGIMCHYSRNNAARSLKLLLLSALIFIVTSIAAVDTPINFGIIFCLGSCGLIAWSVERCGGLELADNKCLLFGFLSLTLFAICLHLPSGYITTPLGSYQIPRAMYSSGLFSWAGFPGPGFTSGDYYPILPYAFMYLAGLFFGRPIKHQIELLSHPSIRCKALELLGRHALLVYIVHQPLILILLTLCFG